MAAVYSEIRLYSPMKDCVVSRLSMADTRGGEFWMEIEGEGKSYRAAKEAALSDLMEAIEMGLEPGRVVRS